jgi:hypothetical protein
MAVTTQLGAPGIAKVNEGYFNLARYFLHAASAGTGIAPVNITGIQGITMEPITFERTADVFQQGGGDERLHIERGPRCRLEIQMLAGDVPAFLAGIQGVTFSAAGYKALPLRFDDYAKITLEVAYRREDNKTHQFTEVYQDLILEEFSIGSPMENNTVSIPFYSYHDPFIVLAGYELAYDVFTGDGSTTAFTLASTPADVTNVSLTAKEDWILDTCVFIKLKATTDPQGVRQKSGFTLATTTLTATTAPAASTRVEVMYIKAV